MIEPLLQTFPLWLVGVLLIAACIAASELGLFIRRRVARRQSDPAAEKSDAEGYIIGAIFGLLAFIIGLTFSIAIDRFDNRRGWVAQEATSISTAFLRADLFDEPHRTRLQSTLRDYAHTRIAPEGIWDERSKRQLERSRQLKAQLWAETYAAVHPLRETDQASYFIEAINQTFEAARRRELAGEAHVPSRIFASLFIYLFVTSGALGYLMGDQASLRLATTLLYSLFALAIIVILDLDRPQSGSIKVSQVALEQLVADLERQRRTPRPTLANPRPPPDQP